MTDELRKNLTNEELAAFFEDEPGTIVESLPDTLTLILSELKAIRRLLDDL